MKYISIMILMTVILHANYTENIQLHYVLDTKYKIMDIENAKNKNTKTEYSSVELRPRLDLHDKDFGMIFSLEAVMRYTKGIGTIAPQSTPHFYPNFAHQENGKSIYLNSMYFGKRFKIGQIEHEIGIGLPPFLNGWPYEYKEHNIVRGSGIAPLVQMSSESIYYCGDYTSLSDYNRIQLIAAVSKTMDIIPTNPDFQNDQYKDSFGIVLFLQIDNDKHLFKVMYQYDRLKYLNDYKGSPEPADRVWTLGDTQILGLGYAYDDYDVGVIYYNVFSMSYHKPDSSDSEVLLSNLEAHIDETINAGKMPPNIKDEITNGNDSVGWSNLIGIKKEIDLDIIDKTVYIGAEWFTTSKNWFTKSVDTPTSSIYNLNTKGNVYTLYSGIYLKSNMSINFSYSRVENKWVNEIGTVNVGYNIDDSVRNTYQSNDIYTIQFVWDF